MDSSIRAEKIKPLQMQLDSSTLVILPCLTSSYWCIAKNLGKWWKKAVDQNPGTGYPSLHTKMVRYDELPWAFVILSSFLHPFIPRCDWPVPGETAWGFLPSSASNKSPWWCHHRCLPRKESPCPRSPACQSSASLRQGGTWFTRLIL